MAFRLGKWLQDLVGWNEGNGFFGGWGVRDDTGYYGPGRAEGHVRADDNPSDKLRDIDFKGIAENARDSAYGTFGIEFDEQGNRITPTASSLNQQALAMSDTIPTFEEWLQQQGIDLNNLDEAQQGLADLTDQLAAGPTEADYDEAYANAARLMGLTAEEAEAMIGGLTNELAGGIEGQEGMSPAEEALRRRQNQANLRQAEQRAQRLVQDSLADSGSTARMLQTADEATMQINNMQLQQDAMLAQEQFERQVAQFQAAKEQWGMMVQTNQMGVQQYIENMQQSMGLALQGYAQQIDAMLAENQQYLNQYTADRDAIQMQVQNLYNAAHIQMGIDQAAIQAMTDLYEAALAPVMDQIEALIAAGELEAFDWESFLSATIDIAGIVISAV